MYASKDHPPAISVATTTSVAVLAEMSLMSPRILFICVIKKYIYWIKEIQSNRIKVIKVIPNK